MRKRVNVSETKKERKIEEAEIWKAKWKEKKTKAREGEGMKERERQD